ncbi:MAG: hypothetical protein JNL32_02330 [Candidatus Kapabacteria bacterium]|nr:hypothetical protein [Candidatus Kapabacteria bacterium]
MNGNDRSVARRGNYDMNFSASLENHAAASSSHSTVLRNVACTDKSRNWNGTMGKQLKRERERLFGFEKPPKTQ